MELALIIAVGGVIGVIVVMALRRATPRQDAHVIDSATAAAIGLALTLETASTETSHDTTGPSAWVVAGRLQQLNRWPR